MKNHRTTIQNILFKGIICCSLQNIKEKCKTLEESDYLIEVLKNAWDSNLEYACINSDENTSASKLQELRKRYIKITFLHNCNEIMISNNGVLFPLPRRDTKSNKKDKHKIKIKNYKLLSGENMGLSNFASELKAFDYLLMKENNGEEARVILHRHF